MDCPGYRRRGPPVGSGVIGAGCGAIVADRMEKSGAWWSVNGANEIMAIRCCDMNGRMDDFHKWKAAA